MIFLVKVDSIPSYGLSGHLDSAKCRKKGNELKVETTRVSKFKLLTEQRNIREIYSIMLSISQLVVLTCNFIREKSSEQPEIVALCSRELVLLKKGCSSSIKAVGLSAGFL